VPPLAIMDSAETALPQMHRVAWQIIDNARAIKIREEARMARGHGDAADPASAHSIPSQVRPVAALAPTHGYLKGEARRSQKPAGFLSVLLRMGRHIVIAFIPRNAGNVGIARLLHCVGESRGLTIWQRFGV
jgi:hypothetical protein